MGQDFQCGGYFGSWTTMIWQEIQKIPRQGQSVPSTTLILAGALRQSLFPETSSLCSLLSICFAKSQKRR